MATEKKKEYGVYKGFRVIGRGRLITEKKLNEPLKMPSKNDDELSDWMKLAKMLAKAKYENTWGADEDEALKWVRELSSADQSFLKGDFAVWTFYEKFRKGGKPGRTILSKRQQEEIKAQLDMGVAISKIAKQHDVSRGVIYRFIENMDINSNAKQ